MHEQALLVGAILHDGASEVGQVAPAKERQRQTAQMLCQADALASAFLVDHVVGVGVLHVLGQRHSRQQRQAAQQVGPQRRQGRTIGQMVRELLNHQVQQRNGKHEHQVGQSAKEHGPPKVARALVREAKGIFEQRHQRPSSRSQGCPGAGAVKVQLAAVR